MEKNKVVRYCLILIITLGVLSCSPHKKDIKESQDSITSTDFYDTIWKKVPERNFIDFEYNRVVAFATVSAFEWSPRRKGSDRVLTVKNDTINCTLSFRQVEYLNKILSGHFLDPYPIIIKNKKDTIPVLDSLSRADCFYPRHNIFFLNKKGDIIHYLIICFECNNMESSKAPLSSMENLKVFFDSIGLKVFNSPDQHAHYFDSLSNVRPKNKSKKGSVYTWVLPNKQTRE